MEVNILVAQYGCLPDSDGYPYQVKSTTDDILYSVENEFSLSGKSFPKDNVKQDLSEMAKGDIVSCAYDLGNNLLLEVTRID